MKERVLSFLNRVKNFWGNRSKKQKNGIFIVGGILIALILLIVGLSNYKHFVPLYSNLSADEAGQIKQTLDSKGIPYKLLAGGTTISVPEKQVDALKIDLAAQGIPKTGQIDYSIFGKNSNFGMTDNQFNVLQRAAVQTELENLIMGINGVQAAKVMINLPDQSVWVSDKPQEASASIVLQLKPGYQLQDSEVNGLYHLVSKSVPNLPTSNIVIMDQNFNYYNENSSNNSSDSTLSAFQQQEQVKADIEKSIREHVQQMLGMMMGNDKVMVNVSTDVDFTKTTSKQKLVQPVDPQTMEGLKVSTEHIADTYSGTGANQTVGTGSSQVTNYPSTTSNGAGNSNHVEDRVNYVFNQINNDVQSSPYKLKDLGIQVMVEPPNPNKPSSLSTQSVNNIKQILNTIVRTSLDQSGGQTLTPQQINSKSVITVDKFNGKLSTTQTTGLAIPIWVWFIVGGLAALLILLLVLFFRRRRQEEEESFDDSFASVAQEQRENRIPPISDASPEAQKKKQLENMARENPQDFVKLLRTWISED
jgi:flagellar M-ring protein FliF